jgi:hypothetical protein
LRKNHIGEMAGVFKIVERMDCKDDDGHALYKGVCTKCGFERVARLYDLRYTKVCTHIRVDGEVAFNRVNWNNQRLRCIFDGMKKRCYDESVESYRWYGAKGIKVCDEWMDDPSKFEEWSLSNGYTDQLTIDRIEGDKDYSPDNCRWVTKINNLKYKSTTSMIEVNGVVHSGKDWARILGIGLNKINKYVQKYGLYNTILFIEKFLENPKLKSTLKPKQSYYDLYMNQT